MDKRINDNPGHKNRKLYSIFVPKDFNHFEHLIDTGKDTELWAQFYKEMLKQNYIDQKKDIPG